MTRDFVGQAMKDLPSNLPCRPLEAGSSLFGVRTIATAMAAFASMPPTFSKRGSQFSNTRWKLLRNRLIQASRRYFHVHCIWSALSRICWGLRAWNRTTEAGCAMAAGQRRYFRCDGISMEASSF